MPEPDDTSGEPEPKNDAKDARIRELEAELEAERKRKVEPNPEPTEPPTEPEVVPQEPEPIEVPDKPIAPVEPKTVRKYQLGMGRGRNTETNNN